MLTSLAQHYGFDIDSPFNTLSEEHRQIILFGSGEEEIAFNYANDKGDIYKRTHSFEGIIPNLERRYKDTESNMVREELGKYLNSQSCPSCSGSRLRRSARNVFINDRNLPSLTNLPIAEALEYASTLKLDGSKGEIAEKILKEIRDRLEFLVDVGLNYLTLERSADTLSGGEA